MLKQVMYKGDVVTEFCQDTLKHIEPISSLNPLKHTSPVGLKMLIWSREIHCPKTVAYKRHKVGVSFAEGMNSKSYISEMLMMGYGDLYFSGYAEEDLVIIPEPVYP